MVMADLIILILLSEDLINLVDNHFIMVIEELVLIEEDHIIIVENLILTNENLVMVVDNLVTEDEEGYILEEENFNFEIQEGRTL